ncbi:four helix bundle protein [Candidatus Uhrbacteria bacterium]|jgi:four helix bundle protein|nr:four helix bundle protein [Candidatus Uhrbacteria bacterium]
MQGKTKTFQKIVAWQLAHEFVQEVYKVTIEFPQEEIYGITSQIRRASISIATNIVEGRARGSTKDFIRFLHMSRGSLEEVEYLLIASRDLGYISADNYNTLDSKLSRTGAVLNGLIRSLRLKS